MVSLGPFGSYQCPSCGAKLRYKQNAGVFAFGVVAGAAATITGFFLWSWLIFGLGILAAVVLMAVLDRRYGRFEVAPVGT